MVVVVISGRAMKQIGKVPSHVASKLKLWVNCVKTEGLVEMRKTPGFHDEPLHGKRKGQRSMRLSRAYRAIYTVTADGEIEIVTIEEVSKHGY